MIEILTRLGIALLLSVSLALLLAWGWDQSDAAHSRTVPVASSTPDTPVTETTN